MPRSEDTKNAYLKNMVDHQADSIPFEKGGSPFELESLNRMIDDIPPEWLEDKDVMGVFCERIRLAREGKLPECTESSQTYRRKLSQAEVAEHLGISIEAYSKKERAQRPIDQTDLKNLCLLYRILPYYLLGLTEDPYEMYIPLIDDASEDSVVGEVVYPELVSLAICTPSDQVRNRCQTVLYNLYKDSELYDLFLQLAKIKLPIQKTVLLRFKDLPPLRDCPVEAQMGIAQKEEFQMEWTRFIMFKNERERDKLREDMLVLAHLGQSNYHCLDFMTRVALSPGNTQKAVKLFLVETGLFK